MHHPTRRLTWTRDHQGRDWVAAASLAGGITRFALRRESLPLGRRGWSLWQDGRRLALHDTLAAGKAAAEALLLLRDRHGGGGAPPRFAPPGEPELPADPFARTVAVCTRLLAARGLEEGFDEATAKALGADPLVLRDRRDEVIAQALRAHAALMAA